MSFSRGGDDQNAASDLSAVASHPRSSSSDCTQVASEEGPLPLDLKSSTPSQSKRDDMQICCAVGLCVDAFLLLVIEFPPWSTLSFFFGVLQRRLSAALIVSLDLSACHIIAKYFVLKNACDLIQEIH